MDETGTRWRNHWVSHIARQAHERPGAAYLRFEGRTVTWAQIHERISAVAAALRQRGVRAGDRVAIMMTNRPEFLETMFAANALGAIVVPVNFRLAPDEIAFILTDCGASLLVVDETSGAAAARARRWRSSARPRSCCPAAGPAAVAALLPGASLTLDELRAWGTAARPPPGSAFHRVRTRVRVTEELLRLGHPEERAERDPADPVGLVQVLRRERADTDPGCIPHARPPSRQCPDMPPSTASVTPAM